MAKYHTWAPLPPSDSASRADADWIPLLEACQARFTSAEFVVECDAKHTVWVKNTATARSVGLHPWMLRNQTLDELLDEVEGRFPRPMASD